MFLDPELQVILSTPIPGVTERVILMHEDGVGDDLVDWLRHDVPFETTVEPLPENMVAVELEQPKIIAVLAHDAVVAGAVDDGTATLTLQTRQHLLSATQGAIAVARELDP